MPQSPFIRGLKRHLADALLWLLAATLILWVADWAIWRIRVRHGGGYDTVRVDQVLLTPLKNHRLKADAESTQDLTCTHSLFPHAGDDPCWWLRRHSTQWQRVSAPASGGTPFFSDAAGMSSAAGTPRHPRYCSSLTGSSQSTALPSSLS